MSVQTHKVDESKRQMRRRLAALPFAEKLRLLEELRDRHVAIKGSSLARARRSGSVLREHGQT